MKHALSLLMLATTSALAQNSCKIPDRIDTSLIEPPVVMQSSNLPVDSYLLALSWSPNYCSTAGNKWDARHQCLDNRFGWVVHGLWPNSSKARQANDQPAYCSMAGAIPEATYRRYLCLVPGVKLMSHEWAKHGTCGFTTPDTYFAKARSLHGAMKLPDPQALASPTITAKALRAAFANANPGLPVTAVTVDVDRKQRLREVRICYDARFRYTACARPGAPDKLPIRVTPVGG